MKKAIILVQSHEDAKLLPAAGKVVGRLGMTDLWILCSPCITVTEEGLRKATEAEDKELAELRVAEEKAVALKDYKTADEYKVKADRVLVERQTKIRNEWKRVPEEDRKKEFVRLITSFLREANPTNVQKPGWRPSLAGEHFPPEQAVGFLNENKPNIRKEMLPWGSFAVLWPAQLVEMEPLIGTISADVMKTLKTELAKPGTVLPIPKVELPPAPPLNRREQLEKTRHFGLVAIAKKLNVAHANRAKAEIISDILAAEFEKETA